LYPAYPSGEVRVNEIIIIIIIIIIIFDSAMISYKPIQIPFPILSNISL